MQQTGKLFMKTACLFTYYHLLIWLPGGVDGVGKGDDDDETEVTPGSVLDII